MILLDISTNAMDQTFALKDVIYICVGLGGAVAYYWRDKIKQDRTDGKVQTLELKNIAFLDTIKDMEQDQKAYYTDAKKSRCEIRTAYEKSDDKNHLIMNQRVDKLKDELKETQNEMKQEFKAINDNLVDIKVMLGKLTKD